MLLDLHKYSVYKPINCTTFSDEFFWHAMGPLTNITHYIPHIIQLKFSTNNAHHITTKIGLQNYIIPTQSPTSFGLWAKSKESPNSLKSHYDMANSMSRYDAALFTNPVATRHLKARCYTTPLKPVATRQYFTKS